VFFADQGSGCPEFRLDRDGGFKEVHARVLSYGEIQRDRHAKGQSDVAGRDVSAAQANGDGAGEVSQGVEDGAFKLELIAGVAGLGHIPKDDAGCGGKQAGEAEVNEEAIPLVGLDVDVLKKEDTR